MWKMSEISDDSILFTGEMLHCSIYSKTVTLSPSLSRCPTAINVMRHSRQLSIAAQAGKHGLQLSGGPPQSPRASQPYEPRL